MKAETLDRTDLCEFCDDIATYDIGYPDGKLFQVCDDCEKLESFEGIVTRTLQRLMREVFKDPAAVARMKDRQGRERMSAFAVLAAYGDPRTWAED